MRWRSLGFAGRDAHSPLQSGLSNMLSPERLADDYKCDKCGHAGACTRRTTLLETPDVLVVHVARYGFKDGCYKTIKPFTFPRRWMDIAPIVEGGAAGDGRHMYRLSAVVDHWGQSCEFGHYTVRIRGKDGAWRVFDDDRQPRGLDVDGGDFSENTYMLVYKKGRGPAK